MVGQMPTREFSKPTFGENRRPDDSTRPEATTKPQSAIPMGFAITALTEVRTAVASRTLRSISIGNDATLIVRHLLYGPASVLMTRTRKWSRLRAWALPSPNGVA